MPQLSQAPPAPVPPGAAATSRRFRRAWRAWRARRDLPAVARSGVLPAFLLAVFTALLLRTYEVPLRATAVFVLHITLAVTLPGTLLWRALTRGSAGGLLPVELAAGTALGYTLEILAYVPARWLGVPLLFLIWPVSAVTVFVLVRPLRRHWRRPAARVPLWWAWSMAVLLGMLVVWSCRLHFQYHGLGRPGNAAPNLDLTYHLALVGELRHHFPGTTPWVYGQPLLYHWFVYAELAADSWVTGLDPQMLLFRLSPLPMIAGYVVLFVAIGRRLTGRWWPGVAALLVSYLLIAPSPLPGLDSIDTDLAQLRTSMWISPTQSFGALLFAAAVYLLIGFLRTSEGARSAAGTKAPARSPYALDMPLLAALTVLPAGVMGAKATFLPLLVAGLGCVLVLGLITDRALAVRAAVLLVVTAALMCFAQVVLFGGSSQGMAVEPAKAVRYILDKRLPLTVRLTPGAVVPMLLLGWCCVWAGIAGLLRRRSWLRDPAVVLLLGMGVAGMAALLLFSQPGGSQLWFSRSTGPYLALAAMCGLHAVLPKRPARRDVMVLVLAAVLGAVLTMAFCSYLAMVTGPGPVHRPVTAFVALVLLAVCAAGALATPVRRWTGSAGTATAAALVVLMALAVPASVRRHLTAWDEKPPYPPVISKGARAAGHWLRTHSDPDDIVATNAHCVIRERPCVSLHFWISAYAQRRVLVEGWGYTAASNRRAMEAAGRYTTVPFWDRRLLAENDAAFRAPSAATIGLLRSRHRVRWLFTDAHWPGVSPALGRFAARRFRAGDCAVYEITR